MVLAKKIIVMSGEINGVVKIEKMGENVTGTITMSTTLGSGCILAIFVDNVLTKIKLNGSKTSFNLNSVTDIEVQICCVVVGLGKRILSSGTSCKDKSIAKCMLAYDLSVQKSGLMEDEKEKAVKTLPKKVIDVGLFNAENDNDKKDDVKQVDCEIVVEAKKDIKNVDSIIKNNTPIDVIVTDDVKNLKVLVSDEKTYNNDIPFYKQVEPQLNELFENFPHVDELESLVHYSKWVKINYDPESFYVVGVIFDQDIPIFICYGVPADTKTTPPDEIVSACEWLPLCHEKPSASGFWMLYQDALTGETVSG